MSIVRSIEKNHFQVMKEKGWKFTYWAFDIHDTLIVPNYEAGNIPTEFYPHVKGVMSNLCNRKDIVPILYTSSYPHEIKEYLELFKKNGIHFKYVNENPEVETEVGGYGYYDDKFYFNVLFEDKAGFDATTDWIQVEEAMKKFDKIYK